MNDIVLKPAAQIEPLANAPDDKDTKVPRNRRQYLAGRVQDAGLELPQVLPVLISQAQNKDEADFIRSLVEIKAGEPPQNHLIGKPQYTPESGPSTHA